MEPLFVLNSIFAMNPVFLHIFLLLWLLPGLNALAYQVEPSASPTAEPTVTVTVTPTGPTGPTSTQTATVVPPQVTMISPQAGQALQGSVVIQGTSRIDGFKSAELSFAYASNPTGTWFMIALLDTPVVSGTLGTWDTTTITDGMYDLRLSAAREDDSQVTAFVKGLRVRNYTPIETSTPTPVTPTATLLPGELPTATPTPLPTITPTPTALPPNPVGLVPGDVGLSLGKGALGVAGFFALMGVYALVRRMVRNKT